MKNPAEAGSVGSSSALRLFMSLRGHEQRGLLEAAKPNLGYGIFNCPCDNLADVFDFHHRISCSSHGYPMVASDTFECSQLTTH